MKGDTYMEKIVEPKLLWKPSPSFKEQSTMKKFIDWLEEKQGLTFESYADLWEWSVNEKEKFWSAIWDFFGIIGDKGNENVLVGDVMPDVKWFPDATLNYAEHIFRNEKPDKEAIIYQTETRPLGSLTWKELRENTASIRAYLKSVGVQPGDRVVAYCSNIHETIAAFLAVASLGAIWSSSAPEFGVQSVIDRFKQIEPKVMFAVDGYSYNGKAFDRLENIREIQKELPTLKEIVIIPFLRKKDEVKELLEKEPYTSRVW